MNESVLYFLKDIEENNNKVWFQANKERYELSKNITRNVFIDIHNKISESDKLKELKIFRIFKDARFNKDNTPYKTNFSALFLRSESAKSIGFYVQIAAHGNTEVGGGIANLEKEDLLKIRNAFYYENAIDEILADEKLKAHFGNFRDESLKTMPKGFEKDHKRAHLIKLKQFLMSKKYSDKEVLAEDFPEKVAQDYQILLPLLKYLTEVLEREN